jgi:hypothetical protein
MYDDTVGAWLTVTRAFQLLCVYCQLLGYVRNERFRKPECKVVWNRHFFLLILNVLDWNITCMLDGASLFYIMFFQLIKKNNLRVILKPQLGYIWQCLYSKQLKTEKIGRVSILYLINKIQAFTNLSCSPLHRNCLKIIAMVFVLSPLSSYN